MMNRDAVHIATIEVKSGTRLRCSDRVYIKNIDGTLTAFEDNSDMYHGIVDPFGKEYIYKDEMFTVYLKPKTVVDIRHTWTHPDFDTQVKYTKDESEEWLRNWCKNNSGAPRFELLMTNIVNNEGLDEDRGGTETWFFAGEDAYGNIPFMFWEHASNYLGIDIPVESRPLRFSCSC